MKKIISAVLLGLLTTSAFAGISLFDEVSGRQEEYFRNQACMAGFTKLKREDFRLKEIEDKIVPLSQIVESTIFYHYTNAEVLLKLLAAQEQDRQKAQSIIEANRSLEEIFHFSYNSKGLNRSGRGLYLAGDPLSSMSYGNIQTSYKIMENARAMKLSENSFDELMIKFLESHRMSACSYNDSLSIIKTIILQENGIDIYFYNELKNWFILVNEDLVQETAVIPGIKSTGDLVIKMGNARRLAELYDLPFAVTCSEDKPDCAKEVLENLIRHNEVEFVGKFIESNHSPYESKKSYQIISSAFNQSLKDENHAMVDQFLSASCSLEVNKDKKKSKFADYLVDKAPFGKGKIALARKEAICH